MAVTNMKHYAAGPSGPDAIRKGRVSLDHGSVATQGFLEATFTFPGVKVGDVVWASQLAALEAGLIYGGARPVADDTIGIILGNLTTAAINPAAMSWDVAVLVS